MNVGAVVLNYEGWPDTRAALDALLGQSYPPGCVVVVDNASAYSPADDLARDYPAVDFLVAGSNRGYAAGMNRGIEHLLAQGAERVLLLTQDCVMEESCLQTLVSRLTEFPKTGAAGPLLGYRSDPGVVWSAGGTVDLCRGHPDHLGRSESIEDWRGKAPQTVDWLDGACLLLRSDAIRLSGPMPERYFLYFEETEYLVKMARLGWKVECVPSAVAHQEPGKLNPYLLTRNQLGFLSATAPRRCVLESLARLAFELAGDLIRPERPSDRSAATARSKAVMDFLRGKWGPPG